MKKLILTKYLLLMLLFSCSPYSNADLEGNWEAAVVLEENIPLEIDNSAVKFQFSENGYYHFQSTLDYQESGYYKLKKDLLITKDTLDNLAEKKAVKIKNLTNDSLFIEMKDAGKRRLVKLFRID